ncbi:MAG: DUF167 domain-containing protein [Burkholderiaceae bacterium]|nr:DUF167 domain-containing protein [Burkholderiaceae bacterium]
MGRRADRGHHARGAAVTGKVQVLREHDGRVARVRLAAPPVDGRANDALQAWLADELGCARRDVQLRRGLASRRKQFELALPAERVSQWLQRCVGDQVKSVAPGGDT